MYKLLIVDCPNLYAVCYYSLKGNVSEIPDAFLGILQGIIERDQDITHLFACWDDEVSKKKKENENYKSNRTPKPENFYYAVQPLRQKLTELKIQQYKIEGREADDIIAKIVNAAKIKKFTCVIVSNDSDMYQLIEKDSVEIFNTLKQDWVDYAKFQTLYPGIEPSQFKYILAIKGKASNNIKGVKGVGEVGAIQAIQAYGSLDALYNSDMSKLKGAVIKKLQAGKDDAYASLKEVEFLTDFSLEKATMAEIPATFKIKDESPEVPEADTFQSSSDFSSSNEGEIDL
jgi:DNA polymerase-1